MMYFDNAATTFPKPPGLLEKVFQDLNEGMGTPGRGTHSSAKKANDSISQVRKKVAKFFGVIDDYRVVFTYSATDALNMAIKGFVNEGDRVLISKMEHNSVLRPLRRMELDGKIKLDFIECDSDGYIKWEDFVEKMKLNPRLVIVSHASNVSGAIQPIRQIGEFVRKNGSYFLVDAAQTAGVYPIHMNNDYIDFLAFAGHKNLYSMQGVGGLILGERIERLRSWREGGTGYNSEAELQPANWPEAFEAGTFNVPGIISLGYGIDFILEVGMDKIQQRHHQLVEKLWGKLELNDEIILYGPTPEEERCCVISFRVKGWDSEDIGDILNRNYGVFTRTGIHCAPLAHKTLGTSKDGTVRISPGYFSTDEDLKIFFRAIKNITATKVGWE
jgi:cysteine desulfurase / selenocysteine lyase